MSKVFNDHHQSDDDSENNFSGLCIVSSIFGGETSVIIFFYITGIVTLSNSCFLILMEITFCTTLTEICFLDFCIVGRALEQCGGEGAGLCEARASISFILSRGDMSHQTTCGPVLVPLLC